MMSVSLEAVVSIGYPDPDAENRGWLGGGWVQKVKDHLVVVAERQCIRAPMEPEGAVEIDSPLEDPVIASAITAVHRRREEIRRQRI